MTPDSPGSDPGLLARVPSWVKLALRLIVAAALLAWLARSLDLSRLGQLFAELDLAWVAATLGLILIGRLVEAGRWQLLLADGGLDVRLSRLLRAIFISMFLGQFLPGVVGPDIVRGYWLARRRGQGGVVATSLVSARIVGLYAMFVVALLGAFFAWMLDRGTGLLYPLALLNLVALAAWLLGMKSLGYLEDKRLFRDTLIEDLWDKALGGAANVARVAGHPSTFLGVVVLSLTLIGLRCLMFFALYRAFGTPVPLDFLMVFIPAMFIITLLPISVGGLGLREASLSALLGTVGVAAEVSVGVGLAFHALQIVTSLPGAPLWLTARRAARDAQAGDSVGREMAL